jgi:hypothetical protein
MYRLKDPDLPTSTALASARRTESTVQAAPTRTYFVKGNDNMAYEVEYTDEFEQWYVTLDAKTQASIDAIVKLLEQEGPNLPFPWSSAVNGSRHQHMRELRVQHKGDPYRILYAFDPRRVAILLLGGNKKGNDRWYEEYIPQADKLYDQLLKELENEGLI